MIALVNEIYIPNLPNILCELEVFIQLCKNI